MDDLVDRIAAGEAVLLGIDDICKRLNVTRATFDRWVKNGLRRRTKIIDTPDGKVQIRGHVRIELTASGELVETSMTFPPPDIRIGNSPKWELATFKDWLRKNARPGA